MVDVDLCRHVLLCTEANPHANATRPIRTDVPGWTMAEVDEAVWALDMAGLLMTIDDQPAGLTMAGHDFAEVARDDGRWRTAKALCMTQTGGLNLIDLKAVLSNLNRVAVIGFGS